MLYKLLVTTWIFCCPWINSLAADAEHNSSGAPTSTWSPVMLPFYPIIFVLEDIECVGSEVVRYSRKNLDYFANVIDLELVHRWRLWHYPPGLALTSPYWGFDWIRQWGEALLTSENVYEENLWASLTVGLTGGVMLVAGISQVPAEWMGIGVRDLAGLLLLKPFRKGHRVQSAVSADDSGSADKRRGNVE